MNNVKLQARVLLCISLAAIAVLAISLKIPTNILLAYFNTDMSGLVWPYIGAWLVSLLFLFRSLYFLSAINDKEERLMKFKGASIEKIVDLIDESANASIISNSNPWLSHNWGPLS